MSATALIVFREVLEASLVVGIVMAAARGIAKRNLWVVIGLAVAIAGAVAVAAFAEVIAAAAEGMGQELFNASVLFAAVVMLGWHNIWMSRAGRAMAQQLGEIGVAIRAAERPIWMLAVVVGVAGLREGSEVVLFLYGIAAGQGSSASSMLAGGIVGLLLGIAAGAAIYFGLIRFAGRYLFAITTGLILFLAAGMASQGAKFLAQAGYLPTLGHRVWDTSAIVTDQGALGRLLQVLIGYTARPDGIQIAFYIITLLIIGGLMLAFRHPKPRASVSAALALIASVTGLGVMSPEIGQAADLKVYSPIVEEGEFGIEARGNIAIDDRRDRRGEQNHRYEVEYTPTDFWHTALVGELEKEAEGSFRYTATAWENIFQFFPQGQQWLDLGGYIEYERGHLSGSPDALEWKLLAEKSFGPLTFTINPIFEKEIGRHAEKSVEFKYAARVKWRLMPQLEPAIETYGDIGEIKSVDRMSDQRHQIGPVLLGRFPLGTGNALKYEVGYLFGLTRDGSPDGAFKWMVEIEHHF